MAQRSIILLQLSMESFSKSWQIVRLHFLSNGPHIQYTLYIIHTRAYTFYICTHAYICSLTRVLAYGSYTVLYKVKAVSIRTVKNLKGFSEFLIRKFTATLLPLLKN